MCESMPSNSDEFLAVSGVGKVKLEQYGEQFIAEISTYRSEVEA
jgi:Superfamily II DNA helicase